MYIIENWVENKNIMSVVGVCCNDRQYWYKQVEDVLILHYFIILMEQNQLSFSHYLAWNINTLRQ